MEALNKEFKKESKNKISLDLYSKGSRMEIAKKIEDIRDGVTTELVEKMMNRTEVMASKILCVLGDMLPDAAGAIYDSLVGEKCDRVRFDSAKWILGVFGISDKRQQIEVTHKDGDIASKKKIMEDLKDEFRRSLESAQFGGAKTLVDGVKEGEVFKLAK